MTCFSCALPTISRSSESSFVEEERRRNDLRYLYGLTDRVPSIDGEAEEIEAALMLASERMRTSSIRFTVSVTSVGELSGGVGNAAYCRVVFFARAFVGVLSTSISSSRPSSPTTETRSIASTLEVAIEAVSKDGAAVEQVEGAGEGRREVIRENELEGPSEGRPLATPEVSRQHSSEHISDATTHWKGSHSSSWKHCRFFPYYSYPP